MDGPQSDGPQSVAGERHVPGGLPRPRSRQSRGRQTFSAHSTSGPRSRGPLAIGALFGLAIGAAAQVHIIAPKTLRDQFEQSQYTIYGTTATFGAPYFGSRVLGRVFYAESNGDQYCSPEDYTVKSQDGNAEESNLMNIIVVRRGKCSFAKKVKLAEEHKNAAAVIIVDSSDSDKTAEQIQATIMADDEGGTGTSIKIPSLLLSHYEGEKLIEAVRKADEQHESVIVKLAWDIPQSNYVMADFWFSSGSREANKFLKDFSEIASAFKEEMSFVPHYHIISLPEQTDSATLCLPTPDNPEDHNKFCAPDPDGLGHATGRMVIEEDLRQICVFKLSEKWKNTKLKQSGELFGYSGNFWRYVVVFWNDCAGSGRDFSKFTAECSYATMQSVSIDTASVQQCVKNEWKDLLTKEIRNHAWSSLALRINGWRYSGPIEASLITRSVCGGYLKRPEKCAEFTQLAKTQYYYVGGESSFITVSRAVFLIGIILVLVFALFTVYKRYLTSSVRHALREEVMLEVRSQMADYAPLEDGPTVNVREMKKFSF